MRSYATSTRRLKLQVGRKALPLSQRLRCVYVRAQGGARAPHILAADTLVASVLRCGCESEREREGVRLSLLSTFFAGVFFVLQSNFVFQASACAMEGE